MWRFPCLMVLVVLTFTSCAGSATSSIAGPPQLPATVDQQQTVPAQELAFGKSERSDVRILSYGPTHVFYSSQYFAEHPELRSRAGNMTYHGGPVQTAPREYLLFYGRNSARADNVHDPDDVWAYGYYFLKAAEGSPWLNTVAQYHDRSARIRNPRTQLRGAWWTKALPPNPYTTQNIAQAAIALAQQVGYSPNSDYVIMTPRGFRWPGFGKSCSYHTFVNTSQGRLSFTVFPYIPDAGKSCGAYSVNSNGINDGVSLTLGHETAETQTDPNLNAWFAGTIQGEIADLCAWRDLQNIKFPNGKVFPVQPLWSNASSRCVDRYR